MLLFVLGPKLPKPVYSHAMVIFKKRDVVVIGGHNGFVAQSSMYHLACGTAVITECEWQTLKQELKHPRYDLVAIANALP